MNRSRLQRAFVVVAGVTSAAWAADAPAAKADRPNIVVIVADDLGYGGLSCQGGDLKTPHIDSLAQSGVRFTNGYVSCPVCSPTRAGLNTGRYQQRFGHELNPGPPGLADVQFGLPLSEVTIADRLKAAGYTTGMFGKWHLGYRKECLPLNRGFEEFFGFPGGAHTYLNPQVDGPNPIMRGFEPVDEKEYLTDAFTREAVAYINHHAKDAKPFYMYLPYNAVHTPMDTIAKYLDRFQNITDPRRRAHAAMLAAMDDGVGAVLDAVRKNGLEERTLVFFFSDNGGPTHSNTSSNKPLRGYKGQVLEGGIRTPSMVSWKGHLPSGKVYDLPVIQLDIMPTALAVAGAPLPTDRPLDGVNLIPYLTGKKTEAPHEALYWRYGSQAAVRKGDWKLIRIERGKDGPIDDEGGAVAAAAGKRGDRKAEKKPGAGPEALGPAGTVRLYNLAQDVHEDNDLASANPDKVKELTAALDEWESHLIKPLWRGRADVLKGAKTQPAGEGKTKSKGKGKGKGRRNEQ